MKLLIDTNVILDACLSREPWRKMIQIVVFQVLSESIVYLGL